MNGLVKRTRYGARICAFGHDNFPYKLKLLDGVSSPSVWEREENVEEKGKRNGENRERGRGRREEREAGRDRQRERVRQR